jgi:PIN domain nuclease of toxin-antitoxin system
VKVLLDTCTLLWAATDDERLSDAARRILDDDDDELFLSVASVWEIAIKFAAGRLPLAEPPEVLIPRLRAELWLEPIDIDDTAAIATRRLPPIHGDPFDRMLVSQAIQNGLTILTPDPVIRRYPAATLW